MIMQVVILAGGLGTRLYPITENIPKPMVSIHGRPFLEYLLLLLKKNNLTDFLLLTGYLGEQIEDYFGNGEKLGITITYSKEDEPLGNGGALRHALPLLKDSFLVLYGDTFLPMDYTDLIAFFEEGGKKAVVVSYQYEDIKDRGEDTGHNLALDSKGNVFRFGQNEEFEDFTHVEAGVLAFDRSVVDLLPEKHSNSLGEVLFPDLIREKELGAYITENRFYDMGTPQRLKRAEEYLETWQ